MKHLFFLAAFSFVFGLKAQNDPPSIKNLSLDQNTDKVTLNFTLTDTENDTCDVSFLVFIKNGENTTPYASAIITGDVGNNIMPGNKSITCQFQSSGNYLIKLIAKDHHSYDVQSIVNQIDTTNLRSNLKWLEGTRHRTTGLAHLQEVQDSLPKYFTNQGLDTSIQLVKIGNFQLKNIIANHQGAVNPNNVYINDAHYDSVPNGPGADDNASGISGIMEISRILSKYNFEKTLRFIGFDAEEDGLLGSNAYVNKPGFPASDIIDGVLNFEMIGYYSNKNNSQTLPTGFNLLFPSAAAAVSADTFKGNFITNVGNVSSKALSTAFNDAAKQYVPALKIVSADVPGTGTIAPDLRRSDHASFWDAGKSALMLTDGANFRNKNYHTPKDLVDSLNIDFMSHVVKATLGTLINEAHLIHGDVYSNVLDISTSTNSALASKIKVFPNPVNNHFTVNLEPNLGKITLHILDAQGKTLFSKNINTAQNKSLEIDSNSWVPGIYTLYIETSTGKFSKKIVKSSNE